MNKAAKETSMDVMTPGNQKKFSVDDDGLGPPWMIWRRKRYIISMLAFLGFFNVYALRVNLSVAIVVMTSNKTYIADNGTEVVYREFDWDSKQAGLVLSSFFYGYIFTQVLGGWLGSKYGGHIIYCGGIAVTALLTIITPPLTKLSYKYLLVLRIIEGLFEGITYPSVHVIWSEWAPPLERSIIATLAYSGSFIGTVVSMPLCGTIADHLGWEADFYVWGAIALVWCVVWLLVVKRSPSDDPWMSESERIYIEERTGRGAEKKTIVHPWRKIFTSLPVWAIVVAHVCENWGFYTMLTQLPSFLGDTLGYKIEKAGFLAGLPYLVMSVILQISGIIVDQIRSRKILSTTKVRKLFNVFGFLSQTLFMILASYLTTPTAIIACITIAIGLGGCSWCGFSVNHLDIAPQHAGVLMGFGNTFATLPGIISPILTGYIVQNKTIEEWRIIFFIAGSIYLGGAIFYGIFASGEVQEWAKEEDEKIEMNGTKVEHAYDNKTLQLDS